MPTIGSWAVAFGAAAFYHCDTRRRLAARPANALLDPRVREASDLGLGTCAAWIYAI